ncbi:hypothetical protein TNCT_692411 [Trichonephila clavata]|uniref:Uncharacterized protein n=1 Tax=Trichonephila clavata TaxID=2740835 RepID=A0A8X6GE90_TRICU|nr:hypothetical protein TNCT_692411 [Trichonephila clavata]
MATAERSAKDEKRRRQENGQSLENLCQDCRVLKATLLHRIGAPNPFDMGNVRSSIAMKNEWPNHEQWSSDLGIFLFSVCKKHTIILSCDTLRSQILS